LAEKLNSKGTKYYLLHLCGESAVVAREGEKRRNAPLLDG